MFIVVVRFPPLKPGKDGAFKEWFTWSNEQLSTMKGFVARRLLRPAAGGDYISVVEYEDREAFFAMQSTPVHEEAGRRVAPLLDGNPSPEFYEVVTGG